MWTRIGGEYDAGRRTYDVVAGPLGEHCEFLSIVAGSLQSTVRLTTVYPSSSRFVKVMAPRVARYCGPLSYSCTC